MNRPIAILRLLRPRQWIKNVFVIAGLLFARRWSDVELITSVALAFGAFSLAASSMYVLNDWVDRDADREHPTKRFRPLASGTVSPAVACIVGLVVGAAAIALAWSAGPNVLFCVAGYVVLNLAYSSRLKHVVVLDVFSISAGFMLRLLAGTWGVGIPPSNWLLLTGMFATLFLGFAKRHAEWLDAAGDSGRGEKQRKVIALYSGSLLDKYLSATATATLISYGLYTVDAQTIAIYGSTDLLWTLPPVIFALFRYLYLLHGEGKGENPSRDVFSDPQILIAGVAWGALFMHATRLWA